MADPVTAPSAVERRRVLRLPALDGIRIVAATAVVLVHVGGASGYTFAKSWGGVFEVMSVGVAIFFVLSGFVVFQPWVRAAAAGTPAPDTGRFLLRRFVRIVPACWLVVVVCLLVLYPDSSTTTWIRHLTFTQIYTWRAFAGSALAQTWTLCVELTFYLVLPALAALVVARGNPWRPVRTATLIATVTILTTTVWMALLAAGVLKLYLHHMWLPAYAMWFGVGMVLCVAHVALGEGTAPPLWRLLDRMGSHPWVCWALAAGGVWLGSTGVAGPRGLETYTAPQFATRLVLHLAIAVLVLVPLVFGPPNRLRAAMATRPMRWLGGSLSYGLYLWHPFALAIVLRFTGWTAGHLVGMFVLTMVSGLSLAALSYYALERPLVRVAGRFTPAPRPVTVERQPAPETAS